MAVDRSVQRPDSSSAADKRRPATNQNATDTAEMVDSLRPYPWPGPCDAECVGAADDVNGGFGVA